MGSMSLKITLKPGEKLVINGAVLTSAGRSELHLENSAAILRGKDVMQPEDANTPARRLYFACMMAYVDTRNRAQHQRQAVDFLEQLLGALIAPEGRMGCVRVAGHLARLDFYRALGECKRLCAYEAEALARLAGQP